MSFLNPVNEPVLRFKSTDAGAPQINYNARVAGDVKAVLKACLVTGYGDKASAGWSIVNEVNHVAEFVSPSTAMSDYRLGVDDSTATKTTWYYQYQDARVNPTYNEPVKSISNITKTSPDNGWQLLVTDRGFYFIEIFYHTSAKNTVARITWIGQVKSALLDSTGVNMSYFCMGYQAQVAQPAQIFDMGTSGALFRFYRLASYDRIDFNATNISAFTAATKVRGVGVADTISEVFLISAGTAAGVAGNVIGSQPAMLLHDINNADDALGVVDKTLDGRQLVQVAVSTSTSDALSLVNYSKSVMLYLDYWGY